VAKDWREQLQSEDPRERAEAIKALALSGDQNNLVFLKEIVENDPDPKVQEYAKKAARHLFTTASSSAPQSSPVPEEQKTQAPERTPQPANQENRKPDQDKKSSASEARHEKSKSKISQSNRSLAESKVQRALSYHMKGQTQKGLKSFVQALDINPYLAEDTFTRSVAGELTGLNPDTAIRILKDPEKRLELLNPAKAQAKLSGQRDEETPPPPEETDLPAEAAPGDEVPLVQIWLRFFRMTEDFFRRIVGQANTEDTLISVLVYVIASMLAFLISSFGQLQQLSSLLSEQLGGQMPDLSPFLLGILLSMIFLTPLSFFFGAGIQYLGMRIFGGLGTFKQHSYILAMIIVPMTVLSLGLSLPALIPGLNCIAGLAGFGLSIFSIVIMVRGMKAVHNLSTGQTIAGLIVPPLVLALIGGCLMSLLGSALMRMLGNMIGAPGGFPQ